MSTFYILIQYEIKAHLTQLINSIQREYFPIYTHKVK